MRFGVNTWVWTSPLTVADLETLAPRVASMGFDWIEAPLEGLDDLDYERANEIIPVSYTHLTLPTSDLV